MLLIVILTVCKMFSLIHFNKVIVHQPIKKLRYFFSYTIVNLYIFQQGCGQCLLIDVMLGIY